MRFYTYGAGGKPEPQRRCVEVLQRHLPLQAGRRAWVTRQLMPESGPPHTVHGLLLAVTRLTCRIYCTQAMPSPGHHSESTDHLPCRYSATASIMFSGFVRT
jgi:hypothetical protein